MRGSRRIARGAVAPCVAASATVFGFVLAPPASAATIALADLTGPLSPADLANTLAGSGVSVGNVTFAGEAQAAGTFSGGGYGSRCHHRVRVRRRAQLRQRARCCRPERLGQHHRRARDPGRRGSRSAGRFRRRHLRLDRPRVRLHTERQQRLVPLRVRVRGVQRVRQQLGERHVRLLRDRGGLEHQGELRGRARWTGCRDGSGPGDDQHDQQRQPVRLGPEVQPALVPQQRCSTTAGPSTPSRTASRPSSRAPRPWWRTSPTT